LQLDEELKEKLIELIQSGKPIPFEYKNLLFPPDEVQGEYELVYKGKKKKEDILADTMSVPFQVAKKFGSVRNGEWHNKLIFGDNLQALKHLMNDPEVKGKVRLIYIDPPFGTGDIYDAKGAPAYSAALRGAEFIESLRERLIFLKELLAPDGSIYLRIDYHYGHYVKVIMDEIFGKNSFRNEIIINRTKGKKKIGESFSHMTDFLFLYSYKKKMNEVQAQTIQFRIINAILSKIKSREISKKQLLKILYEVLWVPLDHRPGERITSKERIAFGMKFSPPKGRHWIKSQKKLDKLASQSKLRLKCKVCGYVHYMSKWHKCLSVEKIIQQLKFYLILKSLVIIGQIFLDIAKAGIIQPKMLKRSWRE